MEKIKKEYCPVKISVVELGSKCMFDTGSFDDGDGEAGAKESSFKKEWEEEDNSFSE